MKTAPECFSKSKSEFLIWRIENRIPIYPCDAFLSPVPSRCTAERCPTSWDAIVWPECTSLHPIRCTFGESLSRCTSKMLTAFWVANGKPQMESTMQQANCTRKSRSTNLEVIPWDSEGASKCYQIDGCRLHLNVWKKRPDSCIALRIFFRCDF